MKADILNPKWKYVPASKTSVSATFKRIRREQEAAKQKQLDRIIQMPVRARG